MKDFIKAFLSFGLATSIQKLLGFVILPIYTRYFTAFEYGIIDMIGTLVSVAVIFGLLQLETSLQRYYYEYTGLKRRLLISNVYLLVLSLSLFIGLLFYLLAPWISITIFDTKEYSFLLRLVSIQLPLTNLSMLGLVLLRYRKENIKFLVVILAKVIFSLSFVYAFVIFWELGLSGVIYAQIGALAISSSLVTYFVKDSFIVSLSKIMSKRNLGYALPQFPARIGSVILAQSNRFFMLGYLSFGAIGIYAVSLKLASTIQLVNTAFILTWAPFMHAQFKKENNKEIFANIFPLVVAGTFFCVSLITLFAKEMVYLLTTEEFFSAHKYVGGLALFFALYIIKETVDIGPKIKKKTQYLSYTFFLSVIVNVSSLFLLIQLYEVRGVVISMIITNLFLVIVSWYVSNRLYYIPYSKVRFAAMLLPATTLAVVSMYIDLSLASRMILAVCCSLLYGISIWIFYKKIKNTRI